MIAAVRSSRARRSEHKVAASPVRKLSARVGSLGEDAKVRSSRVDAGGEVARDGAVADPARVAIRDEVGVSRRRISILDAAAGEGDSSGAGGCGTGKLEQVTPASRRVVPVA